MISRIDHVSIAVRDRAKAEHFFRDLLGAISGVGMDDPKAKFSWQIFSLGDLSRLEIISPTGEGSFLEGFLKEKEGGVHHITLQTPDLRKAMTHLEGQGIPFSATTSIPAVSGRRSSSHPRHAFGVLIQIAEFTASDWLSEKVKLPGQAQWQVEKTKAGASLTFTHPGGGKVSLDLDRGELKKLAKSIERVCE